MSTLYRATISLLVEDVGCENVLYFLGSNDANALCAELGGLGTGQLCALYKQQSTSHLTVMGIEAIEIAHELTDPDYYAINLSESGTASTGHIDPQLAVCLQFHTGLSGRRRRGRMFWPGMDDANVEAGRLTAGGQTSAQAICDGLMSRYVGESANWQLQVFSRAYFSLLSNPFESSHKPVTTITYNRIMSTMRSRKPVV